MDKLRIGILAGALLLGGPLALTAVAEEISLDQVPPAVRATIQREAGNNTITEIEREDKDGKTVFEVEWIEGNREVEIKIDSTGAILQPKAEDEKEPSKSK